MSTEQIGPAERVGQGRWVDASIGLLALNQQWEASAREKQGNRIIYIR